MVRFDGMGFFGFRAGGFNHVGVNRALRQPFGIGEFFLFSVKYFDKLCADDFALLFGVGHAGEFRHKLFTGVHVNHAHA